MTINEIYEEICFVGDACFPNDDEIDVKNCVAEVVSRLPDDVREWLLNETTHVFICMTGTQGQYHELYFAPFGEKDGGLRVVRMILLSEVLHNVSRDEALHTIAHEIAHSRRNDKTSDASVEEATDALAASWGFATPPGRKEVIDGMRRQDNHRLA